MPRGKAAAQDKKVEGELIEVTTRLRNRPGSSMLTNPKTMFILEQLFKSKEARTPPPRDLTMRQVAEGRMYHGKDGRPGFPTRNLLASLIAAGRLVEYKGKIMLSTTKGSFVSGLLDFGDQEFIAFNPTRSNLDWKLSAIGGRLPKDGTACCIVRPEFEYWVSEDIVFTYPPGEISEEKVKRLFSIAGRMIGLCDFRPACKGTYGKFYPCLWKTRMIEHEDLPMDKE